MKQYFTIQQASILVFMKTNKDNSYTAKQVSNYTAMLQLDCDDILDTLFKDGQLVKEGKKFKYIEF